MRARPARFTLAASFALAASCLASRAHAADPPSAPGDELAHARISVIEGELFLRGPFDEAESPATVNAIVREGDSLRTSSESLAELELPGSTFVRLDADTLITLRRLEGSGELALDHGNAYLSRGADAYEAALSAPNGAAGTEPHSMARMNFAPGPREEMLVKVASGTAEVTCAGSNAKLRAGDTLTCAGARIERSSWNPEQGDAFDQWNRTREDHVRKYSTPEPVAGQTYQGIQDLEGNGDWVYFDAHWYWRPFVSVEWRPYWDGYWSWCDPFGWTWVSYAPWGYVTHHYGRWVWSTSYGWIWAPGPRFAGAWVVWASFDGYLGWAPCDFWGRPVVVAASYSYYDPCVWSFSRPNYFWNGGGNWGRHRYRHGQLVETPDGGERRTRPFFTMARDDLRNIRATPIHNVHDLAPERSMNSGGSGSSRTPAQPRTLYPTSPAARARIDRDPPRPGRGVLGDLIHQDAERRVQLHEKPSLMEHVDAPERAERPSVIQNQDGSSTIRIDRRPQRRIDRSVTISEDAPDERAPEREMPAVKSDRDDDRPKPVEREPATVQPRSNSWTDTRPSEPRPAERERPAITPSREQPAPSTRQQSPAQPQRPQVSQPAPVQQQPSRNPSFGPQKPTVQPMQPSRPSSSSSIQPSRPTSSQPQLSRPQPSQAPQPAKPSSSSSKPSHEGKKK